MKLNNEFLEHYRDLVVVLLQKEFSVRYKNTFLGYVWSVLNPLLFAMVYWFAFKIILKIQIPHYTLFLVSGIFFWQAFSNSLCSSSMVFIANAGLIKKLWFPRECLVLAGVLNDLMHFVLSIPIILLMMFYYHIAPSLSWIWALPLLLVVQLLITYGFALIIATCNLFLRDFERLISIFVTLWMWLTPILYNEDMVPAKFQWMKFVNPIAGIVINLRHLFMGMPLIPSLFITSILWSLAVFGLGYWTYISFTWKFAENV
jgi:lipopolysaccharide transport system permease protein